MRTNLQRNPRVLRMASALNADRLRVIGGLHAAWSLADEQTEDGCLDAYTFQTIDEMIGWTGFCAALEAVGWITQDAQGVVFPRFDQHNGASAKRRAQESDRKRVVRASAKVSADPSATDADKKRTREEKRREEQVHPQFDVFWKAYPKKVAKPDALKAWQKAKIVNGDFERVMTALDRYKQSGQWTKDEGKFIPHPSTWLNKRRFDDELDIGMRHDDPTAGAI